MDVSPLRAPEFWSGLFEWTEVDGRAVAWRLPSSHPELALAPSLASRARMPAGVRFRCVTSATRLTFELVVDDSTSAVDILIDGALTRLVPVPGPSTIEVELPGRDCEVEVWLPQFGEVQVGACSLDSTAVPPEPATRWATYGSSITHGRGADGPSDIWPVQIARSLGLDLLCLGFAAECHLDPIVAETIVASGADIVSICVGINIYGGATMSGRTLPGQLDAFVRSVRTGLPDANIVLIAPIASPEREDVANAVGLTLGEVRRIVLDVGARWMQHDGALTVLDGLDLLGVADAEFLADGLHPDQAGIDQIASRLTPVIRQQIR